MNSLTTREIQLLSLAANGNSSKQMAHILGITEQTVKNAVSIILRKLNAYSRTQAVAMVFSAGLVNLNH